MFNDFCPMTSNDFEDIREILSEMTLEDLIFHTDLILFDLDPYERINYDVNMFCNGYDDRNGRITLLEKLFKDGVVSALYIPSGYEFNPELKELLRPVNYDFYMSPLDEEQQQKEPEALTDDLDVITGNLEISNPKWEHTEDELKKESAGKAVPGDKISISADIKNYPQSAPVTFDIYDVSSDPPLLIKSVESKNENGIAKAKWTVEDPNQKGENLKLAFEAIAKSKASSRVDVSLIPKIDCDFVEVPDILFHHNSAVPCLDNDGILIDSLTLVFKYSKENKDKEIVLFGHTDTSGDPEYNYDLSQWRAEGIKAILDNNTDSWLDIVELASKVKDYQCILKALSELYGWPTDPGKVDNANGPETERAVKAFQGEYNNRFDGSLKQDGVVGQNTWSALFEVIRSYLVENVKRDTGEELVSLTYSSKHNGLYPCGESFPVDEKGKDDYRSLENRRVEIVFFDKGKTPELIKPESKKKVKKNEAKIYDKRITEKKPVFSKPVKAENSETIVLEWVFPQVFDSSKPHKQYVNLDSNEKDQGNELTIKVKAKDLKTNTAGKNVYWRVTADNKNSKRNSPKTGIMDKAGGKLVEFTAGIANLDTPFEKNEASIVLACGLAGGDRFTVEAGTDGENFTSKFVVENWRKLWYQLTHQSGINIPSLNLSKTAFSMANIELLNDNVMQFKINDVPERTYYKEWMFNPKGNDKEIAVIGSHNKDFFKKYFTIKKSSLPKAHLIICQYQWDEGEISLPITCKFYGNDPVSIESPLPIIKPTLKGSVVISGKWFNHDNTKSGEITDACISIDRKRKSLYWFKLQLPEEAPKASKEKPIRVKLKVRGIDGPYLGESDKEHMLIVLENDVKDFNNTITHEIGHGLNQTPKPGKQPPGLSIHPHQYTGHGGIGSHCNTIKIGNELKKGVLKENEYSSGICVMFHAGDINCIDRFCDICVPYVKAADVLNCG